MSEKCPLCSSLLYDMVEIINVICFCYYTCICVKVRTVILNIALTFEPVIRKPGPKLSNFFMFNLTEHEVYHAHKMLKCQQIVGILASISMINYEIYHARKC